MNKKFNLIIEYTEAIDWAEGDKPTGSYGWRWIVNNGKPFKELKDALMWWLKEFYGDK